MNFLINIFKSIIIPKGERQKSTYILLGILFVVLIAAGYSFPVHWNTYTTKINEKFSFVSIPSFVERSFNLGLDLQGGAHLVYVADLSSIAPAERADAMSGVRDVVERRVNAFGVSEPNIQTAKEGDEHRLIVELAGISDVNQAIAMIGKTPFLEFKKQRPEEETEEILAKIQEKIDAEILDDPIFLEDPYFIATELNGKYLERSEVLTDPNNPLSIQVALNLDNEGAELFEALTEENIGKRIAIYIDGVLETAPVVNAKISGGSAVITGDYTMEEARQLAQRLNSGALPTPIHLVSQQSIGASLGQETLQKSLQAGVYALIIIGIFMILWYRIPGILAVLALLTYGIFTLAVFKLLGVTLTLAGIVGFILSIGMAVDANILIFARMREESRLGKAADLSLHDGFERAWPAIRDSNTSTLLTCFVLYFFTTSLMRGFALTLSIGIFISLFSAIVVTRLLLKIFMTNNSRFSFLWYR